MCVWNHGDFYCLSVWLSSYVVAIKTMRIPRQYWENRTVVNSEHGNSLRFLSLNFVLLLLNSRMTHEIGAVLNWNYTFYTQWASFRSCCFFVLLWSAWPVIYLMVLLEPAGAVGFAGKAPFHQRGRSRTKATLGSWLNRTCTVCLPHAAFLFPILQRNVCAPPRLFFVTASCSGCFFFFFCSTWWVLFSGDAPFLDPLKWDNYLLLLKVVGLQCVWNKRTQAICFHLLRSSAFTILDRS